MALSTAQLKKPWEAVNLRSKNLDAAERKHIVLDLVFQESVLESFTGRGEEITEVSSIPERDHYEPDGKFLQAAGVTARTFQVPSRVVAKAGHLRAYVGLSEGCGRIGVRGDWSFLRKIAAARPAIDSAQVERRPCFAHYQTGVPVH